MDMVDPDTPAPTPDDPIYYHTVGVFEGAGYQAKGIYRPYYDCTMKSKNINNFCPVCKRAIRRTIERSRYYCNQEVFYLALQKYLETADAEHAEILVLGSLGKYLPAVLIKRVNVPAFHEIDLWRQQFTV